MTTTLPDELLTQAARLEELAGDPFDVDEVAAVMTPAGLGRLARLLRTAADVVAVGLDAS